MESDKLNTILKKEVRFFITYQTSLYSAVTEVGKTHCWGTWSICYHGEGGGADKLHGKVFFCDTSLCFWGFGHFSHSGHSAACSPWCHLETGPLHLVPDSRPQTATHSSEWDINFVNIPVPSGTAQQQNSYRFPPEDNNLTSCLTPPCVGLHLVSDPTMIPTCHRSTSQDNFTLN